MSQVIFIKMFSSRVCMCAADAASKPQRFRGMFKLRDYRADGL